MPDVFNRFHLAKQPGDARVSWADRFEDLAESVAVERGGVDHSDLDDWNDEVDSSGESSVS